MNSLRDGCSCVHGLRTRHSSCTVDEQSENAGRWTTLWKHLTEIEETNSTSQGQQQHRANRNLVGVCFPLLSSEAGWAA